MGKPSSFDLMPVQHFSYLCQIIPLSIPSDSEEPAERSPSIDPAQRAYVHLSGYAANCDQRKATFDICYKLFFLRYTDYMNRHLHIPKTQSRPFWTVLDMQPRPHFYIFYILRTMHCGLRTADYALRTMHYGLRTADCAYCGLHFPQYKQYGFSLVFGSLNLGNLQLSSLTRNLRL